MCGICGVIARTGRLAPAVTAALPAMTETLRHRGPDGGGEFTDHVAALGHRRLSIIDRAGGAQPMANEDRTAWIAFNGEVYNHHALRRELLARGHRFRTASDTETILHGFEEWGTAVVDRLEGMFAFAVYDSRTRELLLARDRLGKKPLFYAELGGNLYFASEMKALRASPHWDGAVDTEAVEEYLALGYIVAPRTIYQRVRKLEPGHWLRVAGGRIECREYWDVAVFDHLRGEAASDGAIEAHLRAAVSERLESEVPLGAFLSGGIDSGLVVSFMAEAPGATVTTTSVGFSGTEHNELAAAALTAEAFGTRHLAETIEPRLDDVLDRIVGAFDEPFADASAIPTYYVSQMARRHVTVALSGDGGDETFGGYDFRYLPHGAEQLARAASGAAGRAALGWLGARWPRRRGLPRVFRLGTLLENVSRDPASAYYFDLCFMKPDAARALAGLPAVRRLADTRAYAAVTDPYRRCSSASVIQRAMYADLKVYLPNDVLVKVDRMSMLHGLEVRCPLLDRRVVEAGFGVPAAVKMRGLQSKRLLRTIAARRLPPALARMPKRGFTAPVREWLAGPYAGRFADEVLSPGSAAAALVDQRLVRTLFNDHHRGAADHSHALWAVWMLERWHASQARTPAVPEPV